MDFNLSLFNATESEFIDALEWTRKNHTKPDHDGFTFTNTLLALLSLLHIAGHTTCMLLTARSKNVYHWFGPLFAVEAVSHTLLFIYEFLNNNYGHWLRSKEIFCKLLVTEMHYLNCIIIFLYVWAIFYFLFQENELDAHPFSFFIFSFLLILAMAGTIIDAAVKHDPSLCMTRRFTGFSFVFMWISSIAEILTLFVLIGWHACGPNTGHAERPTCFIILFTAVIAQLPELDFIQPIIVSHPFVQVPLRAFQLLYPIVFLYLTRGKLFTSLRDDHLITDNDESESGQMMA